MLRKIGLSTPSCGRPLTLSDSGRSMLPCPQRFPMLRLLTVLCFSVAVTTLWPALPVAQAKGDSSYSQNKSKNSSSQHNEKKSYLRNSGKSSHSQSKGKSSYSQNKDNYWKGKSQKKFAKNNDRQRPEHPSHPGYGDYDPPGMRPRSPKSNCASDHRAFPPKSPCSNGNSPKDKGPKWAKDRNDRDRDDRDRDDRGWSNRDRSDRDRDSKDPKYKADDRKGSKYHG